MHTSIDTSRERSDAILIERFHGDCTHQDEINNASMDRLFEIVDITSLEDDDDLYELLTCSYSDLLSIRVRIENRMRQKAHEVKDSE